MLIIFISNVMSINFKLDKSTCSCLFSKNWFNHDVFWAIADWIKIHLLLILVVEMLKNEINKCFFFLFLKLQLIMIIPLHTVTHQRRKIKQQVHQEICQGLHSFRTSYIIAGFLISNSLVFERWKSQLVKHMRQTIFSP